jgi:hypothetical protein
MLWCAAIHLTHNNSNINLIHFTCLSSATFNFSWLLLNFNNLLICDCLKYDFERLKLWLIIAVLAAKQENNNCKIAIKHEYKINVFTNSIYCLTVLTKTNTQTHNKSNNIGRNIKIKYLWIISYFYNNLSIWWWVERVEDFLRAFSTTLIYN